MSSSINRGLKIGPLKAMRSVLKKWQELNEDQSWFEVGDAPWWYNERATLSLFVGAVWKCDGWAFEEFSTTKATQTQRGKVDHKSGRCDIQFTIGKSHFIGRSNVGLLSVAVCRTQPD